MIPVYKPSIKRKEMDALLTSLVSDSVNAKNQSIDFLGSLSKYLNLEGCALLRDYSTAIGVVLDAAEIEAGSSIILSPLTPFVYLRELEKRSIKAIFADVDPVTGCMAPHEVEKLLAADTMGIIIHSPNGVVPYYPFLSENDITVISDITTTIGCIKEDEEISQIGDFVILRMELMDIITAGEGTAVLVKNKKHQASLRTALAELPTTSFLLDMHSAVGMVQLGHIERFLHRRREIGGLFELSLMKGHHKTFHCDQEWQRNYPFFPVILSSPLKEVTRYARNHGVMVDFAFSDSALVQMQSDVSSCPNADSLILRTVLFPLYPGLGSRNTESIIRLLSTLP